LRDLVNYEKIVNNLILEMKSGLTKAVFGMLLFVAQTQGRTLGNNEERVINVAVCGSDTGTDPKE
jgi:hypothetical protein